MFCTRGTLIGKNSEGKNKSENPHEYIYKKNKAIVKETILIGHKAVR